MVKIGLKFKATLENIQELNPTYPIFKWHFKFICTRCSESSDKWNYLSLGEVVSSLRGFDYHFVSKCKGCKVTNTVTIIKDSLKPYTADDDGNFKTIIVLDCRGLEPRQFLPAGGWIISTIHDGRVFHNVDLSEWSWADYCDKIEQPVSVDDIEYEFEKIK